MGSECQYHPWLHQAPGLKIEMTIEDIFDFPWYNIKKVRQTTSWPRGWANFSRL